MIPCMDTYGNHECHGSMHRIAWNFVDHIVPYMELHGSVMNSNTKIREALKVCARKLLLGVCFSQKSSENGKGTVFREYRFLVI